MRPMSASTFWLALPRWAQSFSWTNTWPWLWPHWAKSYFETLKMLFWFLLSQLI